MFYLWVLFYPPCPRIKGDTAGHREAPWKDPSRTRSSASALAAWKSAGATCAGADDENDSEDGQVFEDDLEEGNESGSHGGAGMGRAGVVGRGWWGGDGASTFEDDYVNPPALIPLTLSPSA